MGLFNFLGNLFSGSSNRKAIQQASDAANAGLQKGIDQLNSQQATNKDTLSPYTTAGGGATDLIADMLGVNGADAQAQAIAHIKDSPLFSSQYDTGVNTILQNASATGGLRGGTTNSNLAGFGSQLFGDVYQNQLSDLFNLSGEGLSAADSLVGSGNETSSLIAQLLAKQGQNTSSAILGKHQATQAANNSIAGFLDATPNMGSTNGSNLFNLLTSVI